MDAATHAATSESHCVGFKLILVVYLGGIEV